MNALLLSAAGESRLRIIVPTAATGWSVGPLQRDKASQHRGDVELTSHRFEASHAARDTVQRDYIAEAVGTSGLRR